MTEQPDTLASLLYSLEQKLLLKDNTSVDELISLIDDNFMEIGSSGTVYNKHNLINLYSKGIDEQIEIQDFGNT